MKKTFVILLAVLATAACASIGRQAFQEPVVSFKDLRVEGVGLNGGTVDVVLGVYNPNHFRLDATKLTYRLLVDTTAVGEGTYDSHFTVNEGDTTTVTLPINLSYAGLSEAGRQLVGKGTVNYRVMGDITVATPVGNFTKPYSQTGRFSTLSGLSK